MACAPWSREPAALFVLCVPGGAQMSVNCRATLSATALRWHRVPFCLRLEMSSSACLVLAGFAVHKCRLKTQLRFQVIFMVLSFVQIVYNFIVNIFKGIHFTATFKAYCIILTTLINILPFGCCLRKIGFTVLPLSSAMEISRPRSTLGLRQLP